MTATGGNGGEDPRRPFDNFRKSCQNFKNSIFSINPKKFITVKGGDFYKYFGIWSTGVNDFCLKIVTYSKSPTSKVAYFAGTAIFAAWVFNRNEMIRIENDETNAKRHKELRDDNNRIIDLATSQNQLLRDMIEQQGEIERRLREAEEERKKKSGWFS